MLTFTYIFLDSVILQTVTLASGGPCLAIAPFILSFLNEDELIPHLLTPPRHPGYTSWTNTPTTNTFYWHRYSQKVAQVNQSTALVAQKYPTSYLLPHWWVSGQNEWRGVPSRITSKHKNHLILTNQQKWSLLITQRQSNVHTGQIKKSTIKV